jgi:general secretion pathway protein L
MAHKIIGIDVGAYTVKIAVVSAGLRQSSLVEWLERPVPAGDEPYEERAARVVGEALRQRGLNHEIPYAAMAGEAISLRLIEFAFSSLKRSELEKAVGAELEAQLPHELEDMVYAFDVLPRVVEVAPVPASASPPGEAEARARHLERDQATPAGMRVLAAATTRKHVTRFLELAAANGYEPPHGVLCAPTAYAKLAGRLASQVGAGGADAGDQGLMIVDIGHARTNVCVVQRGKAVFGRTLSRGGKQVTHAIQRAWPQLSWEQAEQAKHTDGFVASHREPAPSEQWARISDALKYELTTLVRDLRQTLAACRAQTHAPVARAVLAGGGARLRGLASYLAEELGIPVASVTGDDAVSLLGPGLGAQVPLDTALLSVAVALEGASGRPGFDLRSGALAYRADYSFLRARARYLAACALLLTAFAAGNAYAGLYKLRTEQKLLDKRMEVETSEVFGAPLSLDDLEAKLTPRKEESPLPKMTAFDLLVEMSKHLPARTEGQLDVVELDMAPKKVGFKAIADSSATIDAVEKKLKEIDCITGIERGHVDTVSGGKQFNFTIQHKCL